MRNLTLKLLMYPILVIVIFIILSKQRLPVARGLRNYINNDDDGESIELTSPVPTWLYDVYDDKPKNLLTLFTTFPEDKSKHHIFTNTLRNWMKLGSEVKLVVFTDSVLPRMPEFQSNYMVFPITRVNEYGFPFFKDMMKKMRMLYSSEFYGYCNADILFDGTLLPTLKGINNHFDKMRNMSVLAVGSRINAPIHHAKSLFELNDVKEYSKKYAKSRSFHVNTTDYIFIQSLELFPWLKIKDVVAGTMFYDSHILQVANQADEVNVVEISKTTLALHQTGKDGNSASVLETRKGRDYNAKLIGSLDKEFASIKKTKFFTKRGFDGVVRVFERRDGFIV